MNENRIPTYTFGPFRLETQWQRLYRGAELLTLTRKRYEILLLLVENAGRVMKKDEIIRTIWPEQIVEESNLTQHIYVLRRLIEDDPRTPRYILTISGEGYQFSSTVKCVSDERVVFAGNETEPETARIGNEEDPAQDHSPRPTPTIDAPGRKEPGLHSLLVGLPRYLIWSISLLTILGIGGTILYKFLSSSRQRTSTPVITPFLTMPGIKSSLSYSRDGKFLAFVSDGDNANTPDLFLKMVGGGEPIQITNSKEGEFFVCWSPDGRELAFLRWSPENPGDYQLVVVPALGGIERIVGRVGGGLAWSPDGKNFAVSDNDGPSTSFGILLLSVDGKDRRPLTKSPDPKDFDATPRFSPNGAEVAFVRWRSSTNSDLYVVNIANGRTRRLTNDQRQIDDLQWSPDGTQILFISNRNGNSRLWQIEASGGEPRLVNSVPVELVNFDLSPVTSPAMPPTLAYTQKLNDTATEIVRLEQGRSDSSRSCLINSSRTDDSPRFSPDGQNVVFTSDRSGVDELWLARADCTQVRQLTSFGVSNIGSPRWSPDGKTIAFDHHVDGQAEIMTIEIATGKVNRITNNGSADMMPAWSNDGEWIYFTSERTFAPQIWKVPARGGESIQVTRNTGFEPIESEDGNTLYYTKNHYLWKKDLASGEESAIVELKETPVRRYWHVVRNNIYFVPQNGPGRSVVFKLNLATRQISRVIELSGYTHRFVPGISVSPAEDLIATSFISYRFGDIMLVENWR